MSLNKIESHVEVEVKTFAHWFLSLEICGGKICYEQCRHNPQYRVVVTEKNSLFITTVSISL